MVCKGWVGCAHNRNLLHRNSIHTQKRTPARNPFSLKGVASCIMPRKLHVCRNTTGNDTIQRLGKSPILQERQMLILRTLIEILSIGSCGEALHGGCAFRAPNNSSPKWRGCADDAHWGRFGEPFPTAAKSRPRASTDVRVRGGIQFDKTKRFMAPRPLELQRSDTVIEAIAHPCRRPLGMTIRAAGSS